MFATDKFDREKLVFASKASVGHLNFILWVG